MAKRISPIGRVVGGSYNNCFVYWLIEKNGDEYFAVSPAGRLKVGLTFGIDDNPITVRIHDADIVRVETRDEAFLHEDLDVYTKRWGKIPVRVNRQASERLKSAF